MRPNIACVACGQQYRPRKNEVLVCIEEGEPYQYWYSDLWECPSCHHQVISGFGQKPVATWHEKELMEQYKEHQCYTVDNKLRALK